MTDLLAEEIDCLRKFCAAIAAEQAILVAGKVEELDAAAKTKADLAVQLTGLDAKRNAQLRASAFTADREGMDAWLANQSADSPLHAQWKQFLALASEAKRENEINGRLIGSRLQNTQQALSVLLGDVGTPATYGPNGQQSSISGRRPIGHA